MDYHCTFLRSPAYAMLLHFPVRPVLAEEHMIRKANVFLELA